jgi:hypothetical protein
MLHNDRVNRNLQEKLTRNAADLPSYVLRSILRAPSRMRACAIRTAFYIRHNFFACVMGKRPSARPARPGVPSRARHCGCERSGGDVPSRSEVNQSVTYSATEQGDLRPDKKVKELGGGISLAHPAKEARVAGPKAVKRPCVRRCGNVLLQWY